MVPANENKVVRIPLVVSRNRLESTHRNYYSFRRKWAPSNSILRKIQLPKSKGIWSNRRKPSSGFWKNLMSHDSSFKAPHIRGEAVLPPLERGLAD